MEQTCSNKIISLHFQRCGGDCPHVAECYFVKREVAGLFNDISDYEMVWQSIVRSGHKVHESICSAGLDTYHLEELKRNKNYNVTMSCHMADKYPGLEEVKEQVQISVYDWKDVATYHSWQKLFLIKNTNTYNAFKDWLGINTGKLHFLIDQDWIDTAKIREIIPLFNNSNNSDQSMDSCLTSWLVNKCCPNMGDEYIDINHDGTVRTCPYSARGVEPKGATNLEHLFGVKMLPYSCKYMAIFGEELNGTINNKCLQGYTTNPGDESSIECDG